MSQVIYSLDAETGLSVTIVSKNRGKQPAPYGVGIHPYLTCNLAPVDDCMLHLPAKQVFAVDTQANPTTLYPVEEMDLDYSILRTVGDKKSIIPSELTVVRGKCR